MTPLPPGLTARLSELLPGSTVLAWEPVGADTGGDETLKGLGYARVMRVDVQRADGTRTSLVWHVPNADGFGHDRRADRAANQLLAYDTFGLLPGHVRALDVGAVRDDGALVSLARVGELYLLTEWAEGEVYATDLRRLATGAARPLDLARLDALAGVLASLRRERVSHAWAYTRAWRDLVGSGEGIAGLVDGYGEGAPGAPRARLDALERRCLAWRHRLKGRGERLRRTHGDFHPFNLVFAKDSATPTLLDTSRGALGDPADDVACLGVNFLFFALGHEATAGALRDGWRRWWELAVRDDAGVLDVAAPYLAWRLLVLANPTWYPHVGAEERHRLLSFAEAALDAPRFDPAQGEAFFERRAASSPAPRPGVIAWLTGLPSSGKSTLARRTAALLGPGACVVLDGDEVRVALVPKPGYDDAGRDDFYATLAHLAVTLARQGHVVLVPATAHLRRFRDAARRLVQRPPGPGAATPPRFVEVFVDTPADECRRRDSKGLYAAQVAGLPGGATPYEAPLAAELVVRPTDLHPEYALATLVS